MRAKKCKLSTNAADDEERKPAAADAGRSNGKGKEVAAEPPTDYIHVRARRGQATDSHSLAERVRRRRTVSDSITSFVVNLQSFTWLPTLIVCR